MLEKIKNKIYQLLRKSEKYTQTDMVYLAKGGFWLSFGQAISIGTSFLLALIFANFIPKEIYGQYKYVLSILGILLLSNMEGINTSFTRAVARGFDGSMMSDLKTKLKWSVLGFLSSLALAIYYYINSNYILAMSFLVLSPFVVTLENFSIYSSYLHGKKEFDKLTKYNNIIKIFSFLSIAIIAYISDNLYLLLLSFLIPKSILNILFFIKIKLKKVFNKNIDPENNDHYGQKLSLINIISTIGNQIDKVLVFHYLGAVELAIYSFAMAPPEQIKSLMKNIQSLAFPKFASKYKEEIKQSIFKKSLKLSAALGLVILIYILLAPWIFKTFFPQYIEAVPYSQIFSISLLTLPVLAFQTALKAQKMTKQILELNLISSISQIILTIILVANFGLWGAIIARITYRIITLFTSLTLFKKS